MLTTTQLSQLKAAILADGNLTADVAAGNISNIVTYLKGDSTFVVWRNTTPVSDIFDAITWANLTPNDAPDGTQIWTNRNLECQSKQLNLQILLQGQYQLNTAKSNIRNGLSDALQNVPSGAGGALVSAGWLTVKAAIYRFTNKFEKVWATGTGTSATPGLLVVEGYPTIDDVVNALAGA